jgi:hypothetical protein
MATKSTTVKKRVKVTNEAKLVLPQDVGGFTTNFRREAARSVGRIMADEKKLKVFLELLEQFKQYAEDRFEQQIEVRAAALAAKAVALKAAEEQALRDADAIIASKRIAAAQFTAEVEAHDKRMEALR